MITILDHMNRPHRVVLSSEKTRKDIKDLFTIYRFNWRGCEKGQIEIQTAGGMKIIDKNGMVKGYNDFDDSELQKVFDYLKEDIG